MENYYLQKVNNVNEIEDIEDFDYDSFDRWAEEVCETFEEDYDKMDFKERVGVLNSYLAHTDSDSRVVIDDDIDQKDWIVLVVDKNIKDEEWKEQIKYCEFITED